MLKGQKSEQEVAVKKAAPDQKELKTLESQVNQCTKGSTYGRQPLSAITRYFEL